MSDSHAAHAEEHHEHPPVPYYTIAGTLLAFTAITIAASFIDLGTHERNVILALAIATFKASLVMTFFMHLKYEKRPIILIAMAPFSLVVVLFMALLPDIANGQYHSDGAIAKEAPAAAAAPATPHENK